MSESPSHPDQSQNEETDSTDEDNQFWEIIDTFIDLANEHVNAGKGDNVSAAMSYAAARFNSFVAASSAGDLETLKSQKSEAIEYFVERFKNMLDDNLNDYIENYTDYTQNPEP